jgi:predicted TPR repeat methyltransferase
MRTAADFNQFYAVSDPWQISRAKFRDKILRRCVAKYVSGKAVLELGCGEGHLTETIFNDAKSITGVDFSEVAIERAKARGIPNARFENSDFLQTSFERYDVIAAIECLYYLTPEDQEAFFAKVVREHAGKPLIISGPIIGRGQHRYFTHHDLLETFSRHGFSLIEFRNVNVYRQRGSILANAVTILTRLPFGSLLLDILPTSLVNQRCYIIRMM